MNLEKIEAVFFAVLEDIRDYLPDLTLVGGWMPHVYSNYLWKTAPMNLSMICDRIYLIDLNN